MDPAVAAWLATTVEEALEPDLPIVDPHHHLWVFPTDTYQLGELRADTGSGHNVVQTVFVECAWGYRDDGPEALRPVGETEHVAAVAAASATSPGAEIAGIVSFADLALGPAVREVLEAHEAAGDGRFRGIRHATAWDAGPGIRRTHTNPGQGMLGREDFRAGFAVLADMGHSFDAWLYHPQLGELADLAKTFPDATIVLDHVGGPLGIGPYAGRRAEVLEHWRPLMAAVAACPNVVLKVGGIGMTAYGMGLHKLPEAPTSAHLAEVWGPELRTCIELFGPDRCMFESNFPVDGRSCSYVVLWNAFKRVATSMGLSPSEKADIFADTARRAYRLPDPA
jgi:predicted TIM-barrel fold metal-dependent hydrolase